MIIHNIVQAIFLLAGIIAVAASLLNWNWFFTADNCRYLVNKLGRKGARWVYGIIGLLFIAAAIFFYFQVENAK